MLKSLITFDNQSEKILKPILDTIIIIFLYGKLKLLPYYV